MKKMHLLVLGATLLCACSAAPQYSGAGGARVIGELLGVESSEILFNGAPPRLDDGWSNSADPNEMVIEAEADGTFEIPVNLEEPEFFRLTAGGRTVELFLAPGDVSRVAISANAQATDGPEIDFSGDRAALNEFTARLASRLDELDRHIGEHAVEIFSLDLEGFEDRMEAMRRDLLEEHESFLAGQAEVPPAYVERTRDDIESWIKLFRLVYPRVYHEKNGEHATVPASYLEDLAGGHLDRPGSLSSASYVRFLDEYIRLSSAGDLRFSTQNMPREKLLSRYEAISRLAASPEIESYLLEEMFRNFRISYGPSDWGLALERLLERDPENPVALAVQPLYEEDMARREAPDEIRIFKEVDGVELEAHVFYPDDLEPGDRRSAYLFFHGGGWAIGTPEWGYRNCQRLAARGMVAISFEYRLADVHGTDLFAAVEDVQSAVRWARTLAGRPEDGLPIDPDQVVAAGFSAGGHLAAGAAILEIIGPTEPSPRPNALVIHSSSYNLTKSRFFDTMTGGRPELVSLTHQVGPGLVPTLLFHGRYDHLAPLAEFQEFVDRMEALDNDFEHHLFEVGHFFGDGEARAQVHELTDEFLIRRGFLDE